MCFHLPSDLIHSELRTNPNIRIRCERIDLQRIKAWRESVYLVRTWHEICNRKCYFDFLEVIRCECVSSVSQQYRQPKFHFFIANSRKKIGLQLQRKKMSEQRGNERKYNNDIIMSIQGKINRRAKTKANKQLCAFPKPIDHKNHIFKERNKTQKKPAYFMHNYIKRTSPCARAQYE